MDVQTLLQLQRVEIQLAGVHERMQREAELRELYADRFTTDLLGDTAQHFQPETLQMVLQGENPFREAISRVVVPVRAGGAQWSGDDTWTANKKAALKGLARLHGDIVTTLALTGKVAVLPWRNLETGKVRCTVLRGYLHPIYSAADPDELEKLLSITCTDNRLGQRRYSVWAFEAGRVTIYNDLDDPTRYTLGRGQPIELPYAAERLPVAYTSFERDSEGLPYGPADVAFSSFKRFLHRLTQENASYQSGAFKQRVIYGNNGLAPVLGPFKLLELDAEAKYEEFGADSALLAQMSLARKEAGRAVWGAAGAPEALSGAGESGEARAIAGQMHEQTCGDLADLGAAVQTDACALLKLMGVVPTALDFSCTPLFLAKQTAEQVNITAMKTGGVFSRYETLLRLQDTGMKVSAEELEAAKKEREAAVAALTQENPPLTRQ